MRLRVLTNHACRHRESNTIPTESRRQNSFTNHIVIGLWFVSVFRPDGLIARKGSSEVVFTSALDTHGPRFTSNDENIPERARTSNLRLRRPQDNISNPVPTNALRQLLEALGVSWECAGCTSCRLLSADVLIDEHLLTILRHWNRLSPQSRDAIASLVSASNPRQHERSK
jgi:hypothetical protein